MKKVININFQGQVIPIEETAYDILHHYIDSLRKYFANEEGRDEIINDIENRIAELFGESLKKGAACITDADVERIMDSMGRPEDFEQVEEPARSWQQTSEEESQNTGNTGQQNASSSKKTLFRDEADKLIGGVASGLANYLGIDPAIIRVIFVLLTFFGGSGLLIYIVLWIVLPSRSLVTNIRKRLYRDTEDRVIAGVGGGLAKYFDISPAIPRILFAAPFILGIITSVGRSLFNPFPIFVGSFGGGTFVLAYIILWIVLPEAKTAAEKLEMRGEKVDLNTIRDTVVNDLKSVKGQAEKMGAELKSTAKNIGGEIKETVYQKSSQMSHEASQALQRNSGGLAYIIGILVKALIYIIVGCIAFALFVALIALLVSGMAVLPLRDFVLQGAVQHTAAWGTLLLFLGVPVVALLVWLIRRLVGIRIHHAYLGHTFTFLWLVGLGCLIALVVNLNRAFSTQVGIRKEAYITQPSGEKLYIDLASNLVTYYESSNWFQVEGVFNYTQDSLYLNTVRVNLVRSPDENFHIKLIKLSFGRNRSQAEARAQKIDFQISQQDSVVYLPPTFSISHKEKWRNQKIVVVVEVPEGKKIEVAPRIGLYNYYNLFIGGRNGWQNDWENDWEGATKYPKGKELYMTPDGLNWEEYDEEYRYNRPRRNRRSKSQPILPTDTTRMPMTPADTPYRYQSPHAKQQQTTLQYLGMAGSPLSLMLRF